MTTKEFTISIIWSTEDVKEIASEFTLKECKATLALVKDRHDASVGVNWDTLEQAAQAIADMPVIEVEKLAKSNLLTEEI